MARRSMTMQVAAIRSGEPGDRGRPPGSGAQLYWRHWYSQFCQSHSLTSRSGAGA